MFKLLKKTMLSALLFVHGLGCEQPQKTNSKLFGQENAVWTESIYLRGFKPSTGRKLKDADLKKYANTLKENNIKYAYLFAGPYQRDGHLPNYPFSDLAKGSVSKLKEYCPGIIVLPWIGGIQNKTVYLGDSIWVRNALEDTKRLVETLDVPGVHIDFEYILKGHPYLDATIMREKPGDEANYANHVNAFHKKLRKAMPHAFISSVVVATAPGTKPWKRKTSIGELKELVPLVDQLSFLFFDTHIDSQKVFEENCLAQIRDIQTLQDRSPHTQYLMSIGTFVNRKELRNYRDLSIENVSNTLKVVKKTALEVDPNNKIVDGISVFCDWQTDKSEWREFYDHWANSL